MEKPMETVEFKIRMLDKLKSFNINSQKDFKKSLESDYSPHYLQFFLDQSQSIIQPSYVKERNERHLPPQDYFILFIALDKKIASFLTYKPKVVDLNQFDHFDQFISYLLGGYYDKALEEIETCLGLDSEKYLKWKFLVLFFLKQLPVNFLEGINYKKWEIEAKVLEVFVTNSEEKAMELFKSNEYYGSLSWAQVFCNKAISEEQIGIKVLKKLIDKYPDYPEAYFYLINLYQNKKLVQFQKLIDIVILRFRPIFELSNFDINQALTQGNLSHKRLRNSL